MSHDFTPKEVERFWSKVEQTDSCWLWLASLSAEGRYGRFCIRGKDRRAHRVAYELLVGPIPEGMTIDHLCRVRHCVNPSHLEAVTMKVNVLRGNAFSATNARKTHCIHGHEFTPRNTSKKTNGGRRCLVCEANRARATRSLIATAQRDH